MYKLAVKRCIISRHFTPAEAAESSTFRELTAVHETWTKEDVLVEFAGQTVGHCTNNKAVCYIMGGGSRQPKLQTLAMSIFLALRKHSIVLNPI